MGFSEQKVVAQEPVGLVEFRVIKPQNSAICGFLRSSFFWKLTTLYILTGTGSVVFLPGINRNSGRVL
jgi:hypothetical protein